MVKHLKFDEKHKVMMQNGEIVREDGEMMTQSDGMMSGCNAGGQNLRRLLLEI
jgi:hypothetical protein